MTSPSTRRAWIEMRQLPDTATELSVALHPEGVDRNYEYVVSTYEDVKSPSTRRAWIEIRIDGVSIIP